MAMNLTHIYKLMDRKKTSQKGENGYALIIGGSEEHVTAPALAGIAALRCGSDSVTIAAPEKVAWAINHISLDLLTHKVQGDTLNIKNAKEMVKYADRFDAVLLGNGVTRASDKFCETFIRKSMRLKVVDADALKAQSFKDFHNSILTPNMLELEMMLVNSGKEFLLPKLREANAKGRAEILQGNLRYFLQNNNVLLVKGSTDIIISRNKIAFNRTGNQGMTKAGTGDVLAGLCVGFLAKTKDLFKSAVAGAYLNGLLGDQLLNKKQGYSFIASDLLRDLAELERKVGEASKIAAKAVKAAEAAARKEAVATQKKDLANQKQSSKPVNSKSVKKSSSKAVKTRKPTAKNTVKKKATSKKKAVRSKKTASKKAVPKKAVAKRPVKKKKLAKKKTTPKKATKKKAPKRKAVKKKNVVKKKASTRKAAKKNSPRKKKR